VLPFVILYARFLVLAPGPGPEDLAMSDEPAFLQALQAQPNDDVTRLVYADWLDDRGDPRGEYLRLECSLAELSPGEPRHAELAARARELAAALDPDWLAVVSKTDIELCAFTFRFQCPRKWEQLTPTKNAAVRFCGACRKSVYFCDTLGVAYHHAYLGHCVAVARPVKREKGDLEPLYLPGGYSPSGLPLGAVRLPEPKERPRKRTWFSWLWGR
jgi:uncharacterized protein (TIGR02996 family)